MNHGPLVYTVVLNHNGESWLKRCLESLAQCSYPWLRTVLVDNASTDNSVAVARSIASKIEIIENDQNLGFCEGNNAAIRYALGRGADYVALLNTDTYVEPEWLDRVVEVGEANPQIGVLGPVQLVFDGQEFNSWMTAALPDMLPALRDRTAPGFWLPVEWVEGSCLVAKSKVFERVGLLDPLFFMFFEECDLCRRARAAGFQIAVVPSSKIHHYRGGCFHQPHLAGRRAFLLLRNSMIYNSTDPGASFFGNVVGLLRNDAVHLKDAMFKNGNLAAWFRANGSVFARLPSMYRKWRADRRSVAPSN